MPQRDKMHELVKQALINSGWEITDDPYVISYGKHNLFVVKEWKQPIATL